LKIISSNLTAACQSAYDNHQRAFLSPLPFHQELHFPLLFAWTHYHACVSFSLCI